MTSDANSRPADAGDKEPERREESEQERSNFSFGTVIQPPVHSGTAFPPGVPHSQTIEDSRQTNLPLGSRQASAKPQAVARAAAPHDPSTQPRFRILRPHAKGGLGEVYLAHDAELHRDVALKQIQSHSADHPELRQRFLLEAEITGGLEHPCIVPVYGLGTYADGRPYYAMKFIVGDTLKDVVDQYHAHSKEMSISDRTLEQRKLLRHFIDACEAIGYAHTRGILHRDLKPGNIMVGRFGETLVVDWGLAKAIGTDVNAPSSIDRPLQLVYMDESAPTLIGSVVGTSQYMSPEQAGGKLDQLGPASDIYSLGATLYYLLTGKAPVQGADTREVLQRVREGKIDSPRKLVPEIQLAMEAICLKALALNSSQRYATALELAADIEHYLADEPVTAWKEPFAVQASRWMRRHLAIVISTTVVTVVLFLTMAVASLLLREAWQSERNAKLDAEAAKLVAEENEKLYQVAFEQARQAIEQYYINVSEETLLEQPGMQPLRRELLTLALNYYERLIENESSSKELQAEYAHALFRRGLILEQIDQGSKAEESLRQARQWYIEASKSDQRAEYQEALSDILNAEGRIALVGNNLSLAKSKFEESLALRRTLAASPVGEGSPSSSKKPDANSNVDSQQTEPSSEKSASGNPASADPARERVRKLANSLMNLGLVADLRSNQEEARKWMNEAQELREKELKRSDSWRIRRDLARGFYNRAVLEVHEEQLEIASEYLEKSISLFDVLVQEMPSDLALQHDNANAKELLSVVIYESDADRSIQLQEEAYQTLLRLTALNPSVSVFWHTFGRICLDSGSTPIRTPEANLELLKKSEEALLKSISLGSNSTDAKFDLVKARIELAHSYRVQRKDDEAIQYLDRALDALPKEGEEAETELAASLKSEIEELKSEFSIQ